MIPLCHIVIADLAFESYGDPLCMAWFMWQYLQAGLCAIVGALLLILKVPERFAPGWFNFVGNSHQLWHLLVVWGMWIGSETNHTLYLQRRLSPCPQ